MSFGDDVQNVAVVFVIGVDDDGFREVLGVWPGRQGRQGESKTEAKEKAAFVAERFRQRKLKNAALLVAEGIENTLSYYAFPTERGRRIRANNPVERILREVRRWTQVVGAFPDSHAALMLLAARLRQSLGLQVGTRRYLDMTLLRNRLQEAG